MNRIVKFPLKAAKAVRNRVRNKFNEHSALSALKKVNSSHSQNSRPRIVFIVQYIPAWNKLSPLYNCLTGGGRAETYILCVPSNIRDHKFVGSSRENDTYKYFTEQGYTCIDAYENGRWFDLESLRPDYVFHPRPYDTFMPQVYASYTVSRYAKVCNILYGASMSVRMRSTVYNKNYYRSCSMYFAMDKTEADYWNGLFPKGTAAGLQKAYPVGSTAFESILDVKCDKSSDRKVIMWTPRWTTDKKVGGSNYFNYSGYFLKKAKNSTRLCFIFRPHPLMFDNFIKTGQMTKEQAKTFKGKCRELPNVTLDTKKEYAHTFWQTDMLVTDISGIMIEYFITGKPMIYCTSDIEHEFTDCYKPMISCCYIAHNKEELDEYIDMLASGSDPLSEKRLETIETLLGTGKISTSEIISKIIINDHTKRYKGQKHGNQF